MKTKHWNYLKKRVMISFNNISERASSKDVNIEKQHATLRIKSKCFTLGRFAHRRVNSEMGNLSKITLYHLELRRCIESIKFYYPKNISRVLDEKKDRRIYLIIIYITYSDKSGNPCM